MATTLSTYITQVRRLLHDVNANFWTDPELTDYINEGRNRLVRDTGCLRKIQTSTVVTNQEVYNLSDLPDGALNMDILNINLYWGNTRLPLRYLPWTQFNAQMRFWQNYIGQPVAYSMYGPGKFYVGPVPDQTYTVEIDTVIQPVTLVNSTDVDEIPNPWTGPVQFYAAYLAKFKEQSYGEAELFKNQYISQAQSVLSTTYTRRIPDPYSQPY
jgi:hypothetical protein